MSATALPAELRLAAPALAPRFAELVAGLVAVIARVLYRHPTRCAVILPLCLWLQRTRNRLARVMDRLQAGTLRPGKPRPGRKSSGVRAHVLPRQRAWLLADLKHEGAHYARRLESPLAEPDTARLLAATPQAQRLLRPLCHILGLRPPALRKPPALARPRNRPPSPLPASREGPGKGHALEWPTQGQPDDPIADLCPRLRTRWPFSHLPRFREA